MVPYTAGRDGCQLWEVSLTNRGSSVACAPLANDA